MITDHRNNKISTIIIENSPIEFAIIAPNSWNRGVIVKSHNAGLDLIGSPSIRASKSIRLIEKLKKNRNQMQYNRVNSDFFNEIALDDRKSDFWFVWKGFASKEELQIIQDEFNNRMSDILSALNNHDIKDIEWSISPIVTLCETTISLKKEKLKRTKIIIIATVIYAIIIGVVLLADKLPT